MNLALLCLLLSLTVIPLMAKPNPKHLHIILNSPSQKPPEGSFLSIVVHDNGVEEDAPSVELGHLRIPTPTQFPFTATVEYDADQASKSSGPFAIVAQIEKSGAYFASNKAGKKVSLLGENEISLDFTYLAEYS